MHQKKYFPAAKKLNKGPTTRGQYSKNTPKICQKYAKSMPNKLNTNIRAATVLLYAHWEGFIKSAAEAYIENIKNSK